jgi:hypothetical protein
VLFVSRILINRLSGRGAGFCAALRRRVFDGKTTGGIIVRVL